MAEERIYTIPLRREFKKAPSYRKTKRALSAIKTFALKHMKAEEVKIGKYLNLELWKHGRKNPPPRIKVKIIKEQVKIKDKDVMIAKVELINAPIEVVKEEKNIKKIKEKEVPKIKETELEDKIEKLEEEKKEVLESKKVDHKEKRFKEVKAVQVKSQREKRAGIIGDTGKK